VTVEVIYTGAVIWLVVLMFACGALLARGPRPGSRIVALDTLVLVLVALLVLVSAAEDRTFFLDAALMLALLGFVATVAAARYYGEGGPFR